MFPFPEVQKGSTCNVCTRQAGSKRSVSAQQSWLAHNAQLVGRIGRRIWVMEAAFFDLDKTVIAKSSTLAFGKPFKRMVMTSWSDMSNNASDTFVISRTNGCCWSSGGIANRWIGSGRGHRRTIAGVDSTSGGDSAVSGG